MSRKMKNSGNEWIGRIPEGWDARPIKNSFFIVSGATPKSDNADYWDGDVVWVTPADYKFEDKYVTVGKRNLSKAGYESCGTTLVPAGSIIFSKRAPIGTVAIAGRELCTNQGCLSCVPKERVSSKFFYYTMAVFAEQFNLYGTGTTFKEISFSSFSDFKLPLPPFEEQEVIAAYLESKCDEIDAVITDTKRTIEEYKKLKQSIITEAVTKGVRGKRTMKKSGIKWIGDIPEEWERIPIKYCVEFREGPGIMGADFRTEGIPLIRIAGMHGKYVSTEGCNYLDPEMVERKWKHFKLDIGDVVISASASMGESCMVDENAAGCIPYTGLIRFKCREVLSNLYLQYFLSSQVYLEQINVQKTGATIQHYGPTHISRVYMILPSITEQNEIVEHLNNKCGYLDAIIEGKQQLLVELESYKKSVIYEYVTGKKEVPACQ